MDFFRIFPLYVSQIIKKWMLWWSTNVQFRGCHRDPMLFQTKIWGFKFRPKQHGIPMATPRLDMERSPQHPFFECLGPIWRQSGEKIHIICRLIKIEIWGPWPIGYQRSGRRQLRNMMWGDFILAYAFYFQTNTFWIVCIKLIFWRMLKGVQHCWISISSLPLDLCLFQNAKNKVVKSRMNTINSAQTGDHRLIRDMTLP